MKKVEKVLEDAEVEAMMRMAELESERDFLFMSLIGPDRGLRIGEVTGVKQQTSYTVWKDRFEHSKGRETRTSVTDIPGIHVDDLREQAIWIQRKGGTVKKVKLTKVFYERILKFARTRGEGAKLFAFGERQGYDIIQKYAQRAGVEDHDMVHPHRLRHYFITRAHDIFQDLPTTKDLAGHKSQNTTLRYIATMTPEKELAKLEELASHSYSGQKG